MNLISKKATIYGSIPVKIVKQFYYIFLTITEGTFFNEQKFAAVTPVF